MSFSSIRLGCCRGFPAVTLLVAASITQAQNHPVGADPLDARARVPAVTHTSPLAGYRRLGDDTRVPWTAAHATVNRIGGWRAYAREAQQPEPAASAPTDRRPMAPPPRPAPVPGDHPKH